MMQIKPHFLLIAILPLLLPCLAAGGQKANDDYPSLNAGDAPDNPGPLASGLSPAFTPQAIAEAERKVGDWELAPARACWPEGWRRTTVNRGFLAAAKSLPSQEYEDAML